MKNVNCPLCGKLAEFKVEDDYEVEYCCSGLSEQCGCGGFPINPVFCNECDEKLFGK